MHQNTEKNNTKTCPKNGSREEEGRKTSNNLRGEHRPQDVVINGESDTHDILISVHSAWRRLVHDAANPRITRAPVLTIEGEAKLRQT